MYLHMSVFRHRHICIYMHISIHSGDLILTETPTIWITGHHPFTPQQVLEINEKATILNDFDKKAFFEMANVYPELSR